MALLPVVIELPADDVLRLPATSELVRLWVIPCTTTLLPSRVPGAELVVILPLPTDPAASPTTLELYGVRKDEVLRACLINLGVSAIASSRGVGGAWLSVSPRALIGLPPAAVACGGRKLKFGAAALGAAAFLINVLGEDSTTVWT
jgi:hypothetical protein